MAGSTYVLEAFTDESSELGISGSMIGSLIIPTHLTDGTQQSLQTRAVKPHPTTTPTECPTFFTDLELLPSAKEEESNSSVRLLNFSPFCKNTL